MEKGAGSGIFRDQDQGDQRDDQLLGLGSKILSRIGQQFEYADFQAATAGRQGKPLS